MNKNVQSIFKSNPGSENAPDVSFDFNKKK
mgnify:CR=1 FL=1